MTTNLTKMITLLARKNQAYIGHVLGKFNLTAAEQPFFMGIHRNAGLTQEELTAIVCVDKAATARAVRSLEEKGFLTRKQDEKDRRQNHIYPTRKAEDLEPEVHRELLRLNELLTRGISGEAMEITAATLQQMDRNFSEIMEQIRRNRNGNKQ